MGYRTAESVLPPELLKAVQAYVDGEYLYIPRKAGERREWGDCSGGRQVTRRRNEEIRRLHQSGIPVGQLAKRYHLAPKTVYKIVAVTSEA